MRSRFVTVFVLIAALSFVACPVLAVPRTVLLEGFTQWNCGPCANWNPHEHEVVEALGTDTVVVIKYHMSWPSPNDDIMHLWNTTESLARRTYYGVSAVPKGFLNGRTSIVLYADGLGNLDPVASKNALYASIRNLKATPAPCQIELIGGMACSGTPTTVDFEATITATDSALSSTQLFAALVTNSYYAIGGNNGETTFPEVFRDMWPNTNGQTITIAQGGSQDILGTLTKDSLWDALDLSVVIFIQDYSTKWMHQAAIFPVRPMWGMIAESDDARQSLMSQTDQTFYAIRLENSGCSEDVFTVQLSGHLAAGWTRTVSAPGIGSSSDSIQVTLATGEEVWLEVAVAPNSHPGMAETDLTVISNGNRSVQTTKSYRVLSDVNMLLVDDDGSPEFFDASGYIRGPLERAIPTDMAWGVWDVTLGNVTSNLLSSPSLIVWSSATNAPGSSVSYSEQNMLASFLDRGGALLLMGESVAYDLRSSLFMPNYLHAQFSWIYTAAQDVAGVTGDPISDGLQFGIRGGDGSANYTRPTALAPHDDQATTIWEYSGSDYHAGIKVQGANYRAVLMGFGVEAIDNQDDRDSVMTRTLRWLAEGLSTEPQPTVTPREYSLNAAYPNPFNPVTTIPYTLAERSEVSLRMFDILGREVATLAAGVQDAGEYRVQWQAANLPSGLYFCRLEAAAGARSFHATQKVMLLK
jgi:hypothetical protein